METFWLIVNWILVIVIPITGLITFLDNDKQKTNYYYWAFNLLIFIQCLCEIIQYYN